MRGGGGGGGGGAVFRREKKGGSCIKITIMKELAGGRLANVVCDHTSPLLCVLRYKR